MIGTPGFFIAQNIPYIGKGGPFVGCRWIMWGLPF
jgi:hypothetical protein